MALEYLLLVWLPTLTAMVQCKHCLCRHAFSASNAKSLVLDADCLKDCQSVIHIGIMLLGMIGSIIRSIMLTRSTPSVSHAL